MAATTTLPPPLAGRIYGWRRVRVVLVAAFAISLLLLGGWTGGWGVLLLRLLLIGFVQLGVYGVIERWPRRLPSWAARWVLQLVAIALVVPFAMAIIYTLTTLGDAVHWTHDKERMTGYGLLTFMGILFGPWIAMGALYRHVSGQAQRQALALDLMRSQYERNAAETRLRLLHAQVEPHFLFNTLANVRELVDSGSPQASGVLDSLIAYLRAAVPRLHERDATLGQEIQLVRAYLELMHLRMPDRLQYSIDVDDGADALRCPPTTLLTLVENAVRHGIDPGEEGGRIDVRAQVRDGRCVVQVRDTGVGLQATGSSLGTGLATLRERLQLVFGRDADLRLASIEPHGVCAEAEFPAQRGGA
jgi:sensor histidine kinase YesM